MKSTVTPHKASSKQTTCNTERPSYRQSPPDKSPLKSLSKAPNTNNKENFDVKSPESSGSKQLSRRKQRSLINQSKILKILNLTTKYEGPGEDIIDFKGLLPNGKGSEQVIIDNISRKPSEKSLPNERGSQKKLTVEQQQVVPQEPSKKSVKPPRVFTHEEALRNPMEYYESFDCTSTIEKNLDTLVQTFSIKALMTVKSLIKPDQDILRICGSFCLLQGRTNDKTPFSWSSIQKTMGSPSQIFGFLRDFQNMAQRGEFNNREALNLARKTLLNKGSLMQNSESSLILDTMRKLAMFSILALRYLELLASETSREPHKFEYSNGKLVASNYFDENSYKNNTKNKSFIDSLTEKQEKPDHQAYESIDNEFLDEERPAVLRVCPSKPQVLEPNDNDKTPPISPGPVKKRIISCKNNQRSHAKSLIYEENMLKSPFMRKKSPFLQKKETKLEKIMKIRVKKPQVVSQVKLFLEGSSLSPIKGRVRSLNASQNSSKFMKRDKSEPIGERLIREDIEHLKKEMRALDLQKHKLNSAFDRELRKVEEFRAIKEQEKQRKREEEAEKRFREKKEWEEKNLRKERVIERNKAAEKLREIKRRIEDDKKSKERDEYENYEKHHAWLEKTKETKRNERKEKNRHEYEEIEWKRENKKRNQNNEKLEISQEIQKNKEFSLLQTHKDMLSKKEQLEKQLENTLSVIMKIREGYKDLDL